MPTCPLCQKQADLLIADGKDYFILQGKSADFNINYCAGCQTAFSLPVLTDQELEPYYPENYEAYVGKKRFLGWLQTLKYKADLKFIKKVIKKDQASIFEIGAGRGEFLAAAVKFGFKVNGLEPSQAGRDFAQKNYKLRLQPGFASDLVFEQKYDLVIARHVFEHLNNPRQVLKKIIDNGLTPGGYLILKLPQLNSWEAKVFKKYWSGFDLPRHRFHYSKVGITKLLTDNGFSRVKVLSENVPADFLRSLNYYYRYGDGGGGVKFLLKLFFSLPNFLQILLAQLVVLILSPLTSSRMVVLAKLNINK